MSFNSIRCGLKVKLESSSRQTGANVKYNVGIGSVGNLKPMDIFQNILP